LTVNPENKNRHAEVSS